MEPLDQDLLVAVNGGDRSTTSVSVGPVRVERSTTDYQACVAAMRNAAARQHPNNGFWPFTSDTNAPARARTEAQNIGQYCGPPPRD